MNHIQASQGLPGKMLRLLLAVSLVAFVAVPAACLAPVTRALAQEVELDWTVDAQYGYELGDYRLPGGWSWDNPSAKLSSVGSTTATATYSSANPGAAGGYSEGDVAKVRLNVAPRQVELEWAATDLAYTGKTVKVQAQVANAAFKNDAFTITYAKNVDKNGKELAGYSNEAIEPGTYVAQVASVGNPNYCLSPVAADSKTTWKIVALSTGDAASVVGKKIGSVPNKAGWLREAALVVPPADYLISTDAKSWKERLGVAVKQGKTTVSYYLQEAATGSATGKKSIVVKLDTKAPKISSAKATTTSTTATIVVKATDASSGIASYSLTGLPKKAKVSKSSNTLRVTGLTSGHSYTFTAKVTDNAGNSATKSVKLTTTSATVPASTVVSGQASSGYSASSDDLDDEDFTDEDLFLGDEDEFADEEFPEGEDGEFADEDLFAEEGPNDELDDADMEFSDQDAEWDFEDEEFAAGVDGDEPYKGPIPLIVAAVLVALAIGGRALVDYSRRKFSAMVTEEVARRLSGKEQ